MTSIETIVGDITAIPCDAIVNAANQTLLGGGGVDGAIHRVAGPALREACRQLPELEPNVRCPVGGCRITPAFGLPARHVLHCVGPIYRGGKHDEYQQLVSCYERAIWIAASLGLSHVTFPAISCGAYRFPIDKAAKISVRAVHKAVLSEPGIRRVTLVAFDDIMHRMWVKELQEVRAE
ncbi:macro domain-containing protein [Crateriforma spongiae]|uniref:macro domain-containing protein n=1 Tax=Crateriforma spongiae TaxID=2724528 RepID=UPI001447B4EA|nr:macro domain-containing protein [Crateriforma spongiae]